MHLLKSITFKSEMKMNLSQKEKYMNTSNILQWLWGVKGEGSYTYSSRVEEDLISKHKSMHNRMHPFIMQEDIHEYKLPSKHMRKFLHVLRGLQILFWIQYYDESSVLLLIYNTFWWQLAKSLECPNMGVTCTYIGQQFWRYLVSSPKLGSTTHVYISSSRKSYFGVIHEGLKFGSITPMSPCHLWPNSFGSTRFPILDG